MIIEIRLLARLFRIPLLRVEGAVAVRDDGAVSTEPGDNGATDHRTMALGASPGPRGARQPAPLAAATPTTSFGRDLAAAESILAALTSSDGQGRRHRSP